MDSASIVVGCLIGAVIVGILYTVFESDNGWKVQYKLRRLRPKIGDMYATYNNFCVEYWMTEDYNELFQVKYVGKKFVRLESIEDRRGSTPVQTGRVIDVEIMSLATRYQKYEGTKNKKNMYDDILEE